MERYIELKRTKMMDEAAKGHRPLSFFMSFVRFVLLYMVATFAMGIITSVPTVIYLLRDTDFGRLFTEAMTGKITPEEFEAATGNIVLKMPDYVTVVTLLATALLIVAAIVYCKVFEKRKVSSLGLRRGNVGPEYFIGLLIGLAMIGLTFLIAYASGSVTFSLNANGIAPVILLYFVGYIIQGAAEEIFVRGYFMVSISRDYNLWIAVIFSSLVFSFLHAGNTGIGILPYINLTLFGIFEAVYICKRGNIWGACAIHSIWNFVQGNVLGISVSGMPKHPSVFITESDPSRVWANGGNFGLEGGFACTIVLLVAIGIVLLAKTKESEISVLEKPLETE